MTLESLRSLGNNPSFRAKWFNFSEDSEPTRNIAIRAEWVFKRILYNIREGEPTLFIFAGLPGSGKTHLASRIVDMMANEAVTAWYRRHWDKIPTVARYHWSELLEKKASDSDVWVEATRTDVVLIDDVGSDVDEFKSGKNTELLRLFLEKRQDLWTIITTNILESQWQGRWDKRVESRLKGGKLISFAGIPDHRQKHRS